MKLFEFCDLVGIQLEIYYPDYSGQYCAEFTGCDFKENKEDRFLSEKTGRGPTALDAILALFAATKGKLIVKNTYEFKGIYRVPKLEC